MFQFLKRFAALVAVAALAACAGQPTMPAYNGFGVVNGISEAQVSGSGGTMAGGVGGALVGGALGSLIGGGARRTRASAGEQLFKSAASAVGREVGRQIIRGVLGGIFGGKR
jgi:hypothetical protein